MTDSALRLNKGHDVFVGDSEMAERCRQLDWSSTSLGPVDEWPEALRIIVRTILESPFAINLYCGEDYSLVYNDGYRRVLGAKHPAALGQPGGVVWAEIWEEVLPMFASIKAGRAIYSEDARFLMERQSGPPIEAFFTFSLSAIRDDDGRIIAYLNPVAETTESVRSRAEALEADKAKAAFLAAMSHELRTPLNAIGGYAQLMEMGVRGPITEEQRVDLLKIQRSKNHLDALVSDVLSFAKLGSGKMEYHLAPVDVQGAIQSVLEMVAPQVTAKELRIAPFTTPRQLTVFADADKVRQILLNLFGNALKFTPKGGVISLDVKANSSEASISVTDTGMGIPEADQARIFEPFTQAGRPLDSRDQGVGLGLAISRQFARAMRGELRVESVFGKGSTFTLTLPRK